MGTIEPKIGWKGNIKLSWPTFNLPAKQTCPNSTPACRRLCYALKAEKMYPNVLPCRSGNLESSKSPGFAMAVSRQLYARRNRPKIFRIHESGDFYSKAYFKKWREIAIKNPDIQFFAFTKVFELFRFNRPDNFTLIASVFPDETRKAPKGAPVFRSVPKGETGKGTRCAGNCDQCGICPFIAAGENVWAEIH